MLLTFIRYVIGIVVEHLYGVTLDECATQTEVLFVLVYVMLDVVKN